jgi:hypothetical protein
MEIVEIKKNWPKDRLLIHYALHNVCNYKCWYCFPGSNDGNYRWPEISITIKHLKHLIDTYKRDFNKRVFELNFLGGEPTLWPELSTLVKSLKEEYGKDIIISMTTNGSRTVKWWSENANYFDKVLISCHPETVDPAHIKSVADLLYERNVFTDVNVLMDPLRWDKCVDIIKELKTSKHRWSIQSAQLVGVNIAYTSEQQDFLKKYMKRFPNIFYLWKCIKHFNYKTTIVNSNGKKKKVAKNYLLVNNLNHFKNWKCDIGIENLNISFTGDVSSACGENLFGYNFKYNLYDKQFTEIFNPRPIPVTCSRDCCNCEYEFNTSKRNV